MMAFCLTLTLKVLTDMMAAGKYGQALSLFWMPSVFS